MADQAKKKRQIRKVETVRERATKAADRPAKPRRLRRTAGSVARPFKAARQVGKKEYYLPMPDNRAGRILNKRLHLFPRFLVNAWKELRQVEWPGRKETTKLTFAVFIFAICFGILIAITDYGLDKLFRKVLIK